MCGLLGWWQWSRAHERASVLAFEPAVPISQVLAPASAPEKAIGRNVTVEGEWGAGSAVAFGRAVDGQAAVMLIREFTVDAAATGTGEPATLVVLTGWLPADTVQAPANLAGERATLDAYLRIAEAPTPSDAVLPNIDIGGALAVRAVSAAEFAQIWPSPLYAAVAVAPDGTGTWLPMPQRVPASSLNLQSAVYAFEWWAFGLFAVVIAVRTMRDNGRGTPEEER